VDTDELIKQQEQQLADQTAKLEQLKKLRELQRQQENIQWQTRAQQLEPVTRKIQTSTVAIKQLGTNVKPYAQQAYAELKPGLKTAAQSVGRGISSYVGHIATTTPRAAFSLTSKGRAALQAYYQGDYSIIPANSIRAEILNNAKSWGSVTLGGAINMYGDKGVLATTMLTEQGFLQRL
jgi:TolA-binding protein